MTEIPDVQAFRPVQRLVRGERLIDVEEEVVAALDQDFLGLDPLLDFLEAVTDDAQGAQDV